MSRFLTADRIVGVILLILCCLFTYFAFDLAKTIPPFFKNQPMRVDTLPRILGVAGIIASVVTIIAPTTGAKARADAVKNADADASKGEGEGASEGEELTQAQLKENQDRMADLSFANFRQAKWGQLVAMIALMIVYSTYLRAGGFIPSTFFLLLLGSIILGERRWIAMVMVSLVAPLAIWLLVTYVLDRTIPPLPKAIMNMLGG